MSSRNSDVRFWSMEEKTVLELQLLESLPWSFKLGECTHAKSLQLYLTLCDPMDRSWPGSSVHGILQARILEWVAISTSRGSSWTMDQTQVSYVSFIGRRILYHYCHLGGWLFSFFIMENFKHINVKTVNHTITKIMIVWFMLRNTMWSLCSWHHDPKNLGIS